MNFEMHSSEFIILRVLDSLYPNGDRLLSSFLYGHPGSPHRQRRMGAEIFVNQQQYIEALLLLRQKGAPFLKDISINSLWSMTTSFITEHYQYISNGNLILKPGISLANQISKEGLTALNQAFLASPLFKPANQITLYPLIPIRVKNRFYGSYFSFSNSDELHLSIEKFGFYPKSLNPARFPPIDSLIERSWPTSDWLCIKSPDSLIARKRACATLGAVALTSIRRERYLQSGRSIHGGFCTISVTKISCTPATEPITPRVSSDIILTQVDHSWMNVLDTLFESQDFEHKSHLRALEYFHRAWLEEPRERFSTLCMALDSLVAAQQRHTKAAVGFIISVIAQPINRDRLYLLMKLRGAVIHGAAPDVYESEHYEAYYSQYGEDPVCDLELIAANCLRQKIFGKKLNIHSDPHADIIKKQQDLKRIPRNMRDQLIIADE